MARKLLAEKANPQADIVIGTSASSMAVFANEGLLQGYAPKGLDIPAVTLVGVVSADIAADNGVIHVIDTVVMPK